jgi:hypothetical protein
MSAKMTKNTLWLRLKSELQSVAPGKKKNNMEMKWLQHVSPLPGLEASGPQADGAAVFVTTGDGRRKPELGYDANGRAVSPQDRALLAAALGLDGSRLVFMEQVHGGQATAVDESAAGSGLELRATAVRGADALVTASGAVALVGLSADCPLVALWDTGGAVCAVAHAGWRSTTGKIVRQTVESMVGQGARPERIRAALSPAIGPCCYEVQSDLIAAMTAAGAAREEDFLRREGRVYLDLPRAVEYQLTESGVARERISGAFACTMCGAGMFHSHRRDGAKAGRQAMGVRLRLGR